MVNIEIKNIHRTFLMRAKNLSNQNPTFKDASKSWFYHKPWLKNKNFFEHFFASMLKLRWLQIFVLKMFVPFIFRTWMLNYDKTLRQRLFLCENFGSLDGPFKVIRTKFVLTFGQKSRSHSEGQEWRREEEKVKIVFLLKCIEKKIFELISVFSKKKL